MRDEGVLAKLLGGCGCWTFALVFNLAFGGLTFQYVLWSFIGRDVPWYWDVIMGLFLGEFTVPLWIICLFLNHVVGVHVPYHPM
jgi:hypothetical protein